MKRALRFTGLLACACSLGLLAHGPAAAADVIVDTSEEKRTYDCQGGAAVINGGDNVLTLRNCTEVTVNGGDNLVHAGTARTITVLGSGNRVNYTMVEGRGKPKVVNLGTQNEVGSIEARQANAETDVGVEVGNDEVASGKGIVVLQSGQKETLDCGGGPASVVGNGNILTLRNCTEVSVTGNDNHIDAGEASAISVAGQSNQVTWTQRAGGAPPDVSNIGKRNVVKRRP
jgi:DUF3060 family protein